MTDDGFDCICTRLVSLGVVHAVAHAGNGEEILDAISACMASAPCRHHPRDGGDPLHDGVIRERKKSDRRDGEDRRQADSAVAQERRQAGERRVNADRRDMQTGKGYSPEEMFATLKDWCERNCQGPFELWFDEGPNRALRFHFDRPMDQANFMEMLKTFKRPGAR